MSEQKVLSDSEAISLVLKVFSERTSDSVQIEEEVDYQEQKVVQKTQMISRIAAGAAFLLTPFIFYLIGTLVLDMGMITERMEKMSRYVASMRGDFDEVAELMVSMESSVSGMSRNVAVIPPMSGKVGGMDESLGIMAGAMREITKNTAGVNQTLALMEHDMAQMNHLFGYLNHSVWSMKRDVNQMSKPMRMMPVPPFFGN